MKRIRRVMLVFGICVASIGQSFCQATNLQFTAVNVTDEGDIKLAWASVSNEAYQIQEADALIDTNTGSTTWNLLYDKYPSQGTNTFWLDTGNYNLNPPILNPKNVPMRFYRIVDEGQDSLAYDEPIVTIMSPTNNSSVTGELTITVVASTDQPFIAWTKLYVDGQEMHLADSTTNYTDSSGVTNYEADTYNINTCEWLNENHVLFATAGSATAVDGPLDSFGFTGHGVSPFVDIIFSNLISEISFSRVFFQPALGQTQQISAVFAADCDWTLNITDISSNIVRTATGSGTSMTYNWDGTGTGETNLPAGVYYYYILAETNGESDDLEVGGSGGESPPLPDDSMFDVSELWAIAPDSSNAVPLFLYPPGFDTNGFTVFSATPSEIASLTPSSRLHFSGGFSPDDSGGGYSGASSQSSPAAPERPSTAPVANSAGTFAIGYQMYNANGTNPVNISPLYDNSGFPGEDVHVYTPQGLGGNQAIPCQPFKNADLTAIDFAEEMQNKGSWQLNGFNYNNNLHLSDLQGSGTFFNQADIGLLILHGSYGLSYDYVNGHMLHGIYFAVASGGGGQLLRMTSMNLGGSSPTNGLKWMCIMGCMSLYHANWNSMISQNAKPYNSNLHMILGAGTDMSPDPLVGRKWADYMLGNPNAQPSPQPPMTIQDAWYNAGYYAYQALGSANLPNPTTFAVVADPNCTNDKLQTNSPPSGGTWTYSSFQVYPPPSQPPPNQ